MQCKLSGATAEEAASMMEDCTSKSLWFCTFNQEVEIEIETMVALYDCINLILQFNMYIILPVFWPKQSKNGTSIIGPGQSPTGTSVR